GNTVGGDKSVGNIVLGRDAVDISGDNDTIAGNNIGLDASGAAHQYTESNPGIHVSGAAGTVIGDNVSPPGHADRNRGNVIVGRGDAGIWIDTSTGTKITGNFVGTDRLGATGIGNIDGIRITGGGGNTIGPGNEIARNSNYGVDVGSATNRIVANSIHDNGSLGIHLDHAAVQINAP